MRKILTAVSISALAIFGVAAAPSPSLAGDIERTYPHPDSDSDSNLWFLKIMPGSGTDVKMVLKQSANRDRDIYPNPGYDDDNDGGEVEFVGLDRMSDRATAGIDK
ncbi:MAG: hypothetical protein ACI82H_000664 [Alphaproteobacteria bacterium]|jgi:hypothetical protein